MADRAIYVVAKSPRVGAVKTRLCPPLSPAQAAGLYRGFLLDSLEVAASVPGATVKVICPDAGMASELSALLKSAYAVLAQSAPGLGAALEECFRGGLANGSRAVAVMASDNPTLPPTLLAEAFDRLETHDVVLGPTEDGGYYLLAAKAVHPTLFREMTWSTSTVLRETLRRCERARLRASLIAAWYDVDTPEALRELPGRLAELPLSRASHTRTALSRLDQVLAPTGAGPARDGLASPGDNEA